MPDSPGAIGKNGGVSVHAYVYIGIGVVVLLILAAVVFSTVANDQSPSGTQYTPPPPVNPERRKESDLYRRSLAARDVAPPARVAMGLPPYHSEADWH